MEWDTILPGKIDPTPLLTGNLSETKRPPCIFFLIIRYNFNMFCTCGSIRIECHCLEVVFILLKLICVEVNRQPYTQKKNYKEKCHCSLNKMSLVSLVQIVSRYITRFPTMHRISKNSSLIKNAFKCCVRIVCQKPSAISFN